VIDAHESVTGVARFGCPKRKLKCELFRLLMKSCGQLAEQTLDGWPPALALPALELGPIRLSNG